MTNADKLATHSVLPLAQDRQPSAAFQSFLHDFDTRPNFASAKVNHGFWEALADVVDRLGWPVGADRLAEADAIARREHFFVGGFVHDFLALLDKHCACPSGNTNLSFSLNAWPNDNRIFGTPFALRAGDLMERFTRGHSSPHSGLILKEAIHDGSFAHLLMRLREFSVVVVGPAFLEGFAAFAGVASCDHIVIHETAARAERFAIEDRLRATLDARTHPTVVLLQAGTLAPYWMLRLLDRYPDVRWIDAGLALSICHPADILGRPWGKVHRASIVRFYNGWTGRPALQERDLDPVVATSLERPFVSPYPSRTAAFVEGKAPDHARIARLLRVSERENYWANGGPLFQALGDSYTKYMGLPDGIAATPCANAGIALEALARFHESTKGRKLRWVVSAFSFVNLARGYFAGARRLDCDEHGMFDLEQLQRIDGDAYDGFIVTNIFGLWRDFAPYVRFAEATGKLLLIDNAAGLSRSVASWPYQVFSLHHTKPHGAGEGGLFLAPAGEREHILSLLDYRSEPDIDPAAWLNNGKLSDIACAYHLDRLERNPEWAPLYAMQGHRIHLIATRAGLQPAFPFDPMTIATSQPYVAPRCISVEDVQKFGLLTLGKYYKPLAPLPKVQALFDRLVNIPCHPDVALVDGPALTDALKRLVDGPT